MGCAGDHPGGMGLTQTAGPPQAAFGQMYPARPHPGGETGVGADEQQHPTLPAGANQMLGHTVRLRGAERAVDHRHPRRQAEDEGHRIWRPLGIGEHKHARRRRRRLSRGAVKP